MILKTIIVARILLPYGLAKDIHTYNLNKEFHHETLLPNEEPDIECVASDLDIPFPRQFSICFRTKPMSHIIHELRGWSWRSIISFGEMDKKTRRLTNGFVFGYWLSGPWFGLQSKESESLSWTFTFEARSWPLQVCMFTTSRQSEFL